MATLALGELMVQWTSVGQVESVEGLDTRSSGTSLMGSARLELSVFRGHRMLKLLGATTTLGVGLAMLVLSLRCSLLRARLVPCRALLKSQLVNVELVRWRRFAPRAPMPMPCALVEVILMLALSHTCLASTWQCKNDENSVNSSSD